MEVYVADGKTHVRVVPPPTPAPTTVIPQHRNHTNHSGLPSDAGSVAVGIVFCALALLSLIAVAWVRLRLRSSKSDAGESLLNS